MCKGKIFCIALSFLIQGVIYYFLSQWILARNNCSPEVVDLSDLPFDFAIDVVYFRERKCGNVLLIISDIPLLEDMPEISDELKKLAKINLEIDYNVSDQIKFREYRFMRAYLMISIAWIISSAVIIIFMCFQIMINTPIILIILQIPWILVLAGGTILDIIVTICHINDMMHLKTVKSSFEYIGIKENKDLLALLANFDFIFTIPPIIMICFSSRLVLVWLMNVISIYCGTHSVVMNIARCCVGAGTAAVVPS